MKKYEMFLEGMKKLLVYFFCGFLVEVMVIIK